MVQPYYYASIIICVAIAGYHIQFSMAQNPDQCSESEVLKCVKSFQEQGKNNTFIYFPQDIDKFCKLISESATCFDKKQKECDKNNVTIEITTHLENFNSFKTELCTEGRALKTAYKINQKCLVASTEEIMKCKPQNISVLLSNLQPSSRRNQTDFIKTMCCSTGKTESCIMKAVESKCGKDGNQYVQGVLALGSIATLIDANKCAAYKHETPACQSTADMHTAGIALVSSLLLLYFICYNLC